MKDLPQQEAIELLQDAKTMLLEIEHNRQMPPTAQCQYQYIALGKRIKEFLEDMED